MSSEAWAILSASAWAMDSILVRKGTCHSTPSTAAIFSFLVNTAVLMPYVFYAFPREKIFAAGNLFFVLSGLIQPAFVRVLFYMGIVRLGVSRAGPIRGTSPLFSMIIAFVVLGERPGWIVYAGAFLTVSGTWLVSYKREGEAKWRALDLLFPLSAAILAAVSQNIRKIGLTSVGEPIIGAAITTGTSLLCLSGSLLLSGKIRTLQFNRESLPFFGGAAFSSLVGQVLTFVALNQGDVSVVSPLVNTTPLFIIAFSAIFLRDVEKINRTVVAGVLLLVAGIGVIASR